MPDITLATEPRTSRGSRPSGRLRREGKVPAVVYGLGADSVSITVPSRELQHILAGHEPYPALVVDRHWGLVAANSALSLFIEGVAAELLEPPVNVLRLSLHPQGLAPRIVNLAEWREHVLSRLRHQVDLSADPVLAALRAELTRTLRPIEWRAELRHYRDAGDGDANAR